jgi:hypothetical protein
VGSQFYSEWWQIGAPEEIRTPDPQIRSLARRSESIQTFCKPTPLRPQGVNGLTPRLQTRRCVGAAARATARRLAEKQKGLRCASQAPSTNTVRSRTSRLLTAPVPPSKGFFPVDARPAPWRPDRGESDFDYFRARPTARTRNRLPFENEFSSAELDEGGFDCFVHVIVERDATGQPTRRARGAVGERVAIQGGLKFELYTANDGTTKISKTIFVDHVLAVRQPPKERKPKSPPAGSKAADALAKRSTLPDATPETAAGGPAFFDDDIPFGPVR